MNILSSILEKIIPGALAQPTVSNARPSPLLPDQAEAQAQPSTNANDGPAQSAVDIDEVLRKMESSKGTRLDWRHSIVDLMKTLDMDSGLSARQQLAKELNYTGDLSNSAAMNMWLHEQVMRKLEANGGRLPADLKH